MREWGARAGEWSRRSGGRGAGLVKEGKQIGCCLFSDFLTEYVFGYLLESPHKREILTSIQNIYSLNY